MTLNTNDLQTVLDAARSTVNETTDALSQYTFFDQYRTPLPWAVGGFTKDDCLTFELTGQWSDPTHIGWTSESIFNPSPIVRGDELHLFYRASPKKESLASRIGHAVYTDATGWQDDGAPAIWSTLDNELLGVEDPKVYQAGDRYYLYYNGIYPLAEPTDTNSAEVGCDINVAWSTDLRTWTKLGPITDPAQSGHWAKGAVIPRDADGNAVRINGSYLMYISEGFGGQLHIGRSDNLTDWHFEPNPYLDLLPLNGHMHEVATAIVTGNDLVLDFFYGDTGNTWSAGQALYALGDPFTQIDVATGGTLAWGGLVSWHGKWTFAQGWDARPGHRELEFYSTSR